jgi:ribonuclease Z
VEVILLGTGSPLPSPDRAGPATLVRAGAANLLFDCGRGVIMRLAAAGVPPLALTAVLLTHMHSDHVTDLNDVITTRWVMAPQPLPLTVIGPVGAKALVGATLAMLAFDVKYRIDHHADLNDPPKVEVTELQPGETIALGDVRVTAQATDHAPVAPTLGYRIEHAGVACAIAGDTVPCPGLDAICADADVYVQTVIRDDLVRMVANRRLKDILDYHSTVAQAGQTAARNRVKTLMLTHYVPTMPKGQEAEWRAIAAANFDGEIVLGDDMTAVSVQAKG